MEGILSDTVFKMLVFNGSFLVFRNVIFSLSGLTLYSANWIMDTLQNSRTETSCQWPSREDCLLARGAGFWGLWDGPVGEVDEGRFPGTVWWGDLQGPLRNSCVCPIGEPSSRKVHASQRCAETTITVSS